MNIDPTVYLLSVVGVAGIPQIEQFIEWLKSRWGLSTKLSPIAALLTGVILNDGVALLMGTSLLTGLEWGLVAGFGAGIWHEITNI